MKIKAIVILTIFLTLALGMEAQSVLTTDAMIRIAEQKAKQERTTVDGKKAAPAQHPMLMLVVKVADEGAADTYARLRKQGAIIRGRIGQQAIIQVPFDKVETIAQMDGILRIDVGHKGELNTDVTRQATGVDLVDGSASQVSTPLTGKGVTVCVIDMGMDFNHPAFKDDQGRSRIKCVYNMVSDKGRKFVFNDPVAGEIEFPGSVFDTPELIAKLVYDTKALEHGSHTTGIAAGSRSPQGFGGMAPEADIVYLPMASLFTEEEAAAAETDPGAGGGGQKDPNYNDISEVSQIVELYIAFASAYAQQSDQPMVLSASIGSHMGPHDGTGAMPEAISALSKYAIPVFSSGNEGGSQYHAQYQFADDKPSFSVGLAVFPGMAGFEDDDPVMPSFVYNFSEWVRGYTRGSQNGEIGLRLNLVARDNDMNIVENTWSSPVIKVTPGDPDQMVTINTADYPELEKYFRGKVLLSVRTMGNGKMELTVMPSAFCKAAEGRTKHYALTITVTGAPGTAVDLWQKNYRFVPYIGEGYIVGDDLISASDWTSTPDVISVGAWCANTTARPNTADSEEESTATETLGDIATFSSYGQMFNDVTQPVVCAPGVNVVSSLNHYCGDPSPTYIDDMTWEGYPYGSLSGTSMACPAVAGIIALWLQANPKLTLADIKDVLANSCDNDDFTAKNPIRWGYGKINAKKGVDYIQKATGIRILPSKREEGVYYNLQGQRVIPSTQGLYISADKRAVIYRHR